MEKFSIIIGAKVTIWLTTNTTYLIEEQKRTEWSTPNTKTYVNFIFKLVMESVISQVSSGNRYFYSEATTASTKV